MSADKTLTLGKNVLVFACFVALAVMLFGVLLHAPVSPVLVLLVLAYTLPGVAGAAVKLYRDLRDDHLSA